METKYLIVGGGVTGLSFANFCKSDDWILCEGGPEVGGYCKSIHQDGFTWDYSGHFFHFSTDLAKDLFLSKMKKIKIHEVSKLTSILYGNNKIDFPFQKNIHQLPRDEFIECLSDLADRPTDPPTNFLEMLYGKFGKGIVEKFLKPYNEKLYACNLNDLDIDAMGRFFPYAELEDIIKNFKVKNSDSYNSTFIYPENGAFEFIKALLQDLSSSKIKLNHKLSRVDYKNKIAHFDNGSQIKYEFLISSIPFPPLLRLCGIECSENIYTSNKVLVFNLGFDGPSAVKDHWIYFPDKDTSFYRVGFYNNIIKSNRMSLYVELGIKSTEKIDESQILKKVLQDLKKHNIIRDQNLISRKAITMNPAYVHVKKESIDDLAIKNKTLNSCGIYSIGRYGGWKYCSIEDNVIEAKKVYDSLDETPKKVHKDDIR